MWLQQNPRQFGMTCLQRCAGANAGPRPPFLPLRGFPYFPNVALALAMATAGRADRGGHASPCLRPCRGQPSAPTHRYGQTAAACCIIGETVPLPLTEPSGPHQGPTRASCRVCHNNSPGQMWAVRGRRGRGGDKNLQSDASLPDFAHSIRTRAVRATSPGCCD